MKLHLLLSLLLIINSFLDSSKGQRSGKRPASKSTRFKIKKVKQTEGGESARLQCLSCSTDFSSRRLDITDACYNPASAPLDKIKTSLLTVCPPEVRFCKVEVYRIGHVFSGIARSCGGSYCVETCSQRGYGAEAETCTQCCGGIHTNETDIAGSGADKFNCT